MSFFRRHPPNVIGYESCCQKHGCQSEIFPFCPLQVVSKSCGRGILDYPASVCQSVRPSVRLEFWSDFDDIAHNVLWAKSTASQIPCSSLAMSNGIGYSTVGIGPNIRVFGICVSAKSLKVNHKLILHAISLTPD